MAYKLIKKKDEIPAELKVKFSQSALYSKGIVFKNRVPVINDFPECFDTITDEEYKKTLTLTNNRN